MIILVYGTSGELIKVAPLIKELESTDKLITINTNQQPNQVTALLKEAGLPEPTVIVSRGNRGEELSKVWHMLLWLPTVVANLLRNNRRVRRLANAKEAAPIVMVHGDTITTVIGTIYARLNGFKVAHIEAGLRSHDWRNPFPEELDRMIVSKMARVHFAPGNVPTSNLKKLQVKGDIIDTKLNTVLDSMMMARKSTIEHGVTGVPGHYGLVSIHRNELMAKPDVLKQLIVTLNEHANEHPLVFLDHPVTKAKVTELGYDELFTGKHMIRIPKQSYYRFMKLLAKADYVVTDSGGLQEESAYINMPCLLHRLTTERMEGIGANVVLSKFDNNVVKEFLGNPAKYTGTSADTKISPTKIITRYLRDNKYA